MGLYDFKVGDKATPPAAVETPPVDATPPRVDTPTPGVDHDIVGGPPWETLEDSPPITCRQCFNVYFAWEWIQTGDNRVGVWSKTDAWCRATGVQVQGDVDTERRCINADPTPANGSVNT